MIAKVIRLRETEIEMINELGNNQSAVIREAVGFLYRAKFGQDKFNELDKKQRALSLAKIGLSLPA